MSENNRKKLIAAIKIIVSDADEIGGCCDPECRYRFDCKEPFCDLFKQSLESVKNSPVFNRATHKKGLAIRCDECVDIFDRLGFRIIKNGKYEGTEPGKF